MGAQLAAAILVLPPRLRRAVHEGRLRGRMQRRRSDGGRSHALVPAVVVVPLRSRRGAVQLLLVEYPRATSPGRSAFATVVEIGLLLRPGSSCRSLVHGLLLLLLLPFRRDERVEDEELPARVVIPGPYRRRQAVVHNVLQFVTRLGLGVFLLGYSQHPSRLGRPLVLLPIGLEYVPEEGRDAVVGRTESAGDAGALLGSEYGAYVILVEVDELLELLGHVGFGRVVDGRAVLDGRILERVEGTGHGLE
mmetsp:Transcript_40623/g.122264  ORF Transcript_40623/g.122264 Transcript_40623/m.122264 type:complete len:249 (-) Transcript_40623:1180-1926(-)